MKLQWARRVRPHYTAGREETVMKVLSALVELGSADHERFLRAAIDNSVVRFTDEDLFGNSRVVEVRVFSLEHAGDKTKFVFRTLK